MLKAERIALRRASGFSMVELLIAVTIGLLLLSGLTVVFVNSSSANRELQKTAQQIENGRYAIDMLSQDIHHAGFYGHLHQIASPAATPDPCEIASTANLLDGLGYGIQGYRAADLITAADITASTCDEKALLVAANMKVGSDVVVVRRASTKVLAAADTATTNEVYLQASGTQAEVQLGNGAVVGTNKASGAASTLFLNNGTTPAPIRKLHVHVYFVAPCSQGSGASGICTATDDATPTLKRLELVSEGGVTKMKLVPLVEGIEYLKIEFGIDNLPAVANAATGLTGDAQVDSYTTAPADWSTVIGAKVYVLARNTDPTPGYTDSKTYVMGTVSVVNPNDRFKRHVYSAEVRMVNPSGRREVP
jgi:type IV pilus assembly protein PilW